MSSSISKGLDHLLQSFFQGCTLLILGGLLVHLSKVGFQIILQTSTHPRADPIGKGSHFIILLLGPFVERMVVALGTHHLRTEEKLRGVGHVVEFHTRIPEVVTGCPIFPWIPLGSDQRVSYLVKGGIFIYPLANPMVIKFTCTNLIAASHSALQTKQIRPPIEHLAVIGG